MSEFTEGIEIMREHALDIIKNAHDLERAAFVIENTKFFFTPGGLDSIDSLRAIVSDAEEE